MTNEEIRAWLMAHSEKEFQKFTSGLIPGSAPVLGVRIPALRGLAKQLAGEDWRTWLAGAANDTYEEIMLQGLCIGYAKADIEELLVYAAAFIPRIQDWSVSDSFCSAFKTAAKHRARVWEFLMQYQSSEQEFEQRVVAVMLMDYYLVEEYIDRVFSVWEGLKHEGYYCRMGVAWGIATAYAKFPEKTHAFLSGSSLDDFTYNKAIQKMLESYRITPERKEVLRGMKRGTAGRAVRRYTV